MKNITAFLSMIAFSEGTSTHPKTKHDGYDVVVSGRNSPGVITDFSKHPGILVEVNSKGLKSTAAGRYQFLLRYWNAYAKRLGLMDFSPESQDRAAIEVLRETGAIPCILGGDIRGAIAKCCHIWASLPGSPYGQPVRPIGELQRVYDRALALHRESGS